MAISVMVIIKYFCPEVEFISIKIMETGERGSIDSFQSGVRMVLKRKDKTCAYECWNNKLYRCKKIENIIKQMVSNK